MKLLEKFNWKVVVPVVALVLVVWFFAKDRFFNDFDLPINGTTTSETIEIEENGEFTTKEIMITDDVKHSVPLEDIRGGGPPRDGIPPIDSPKYYSTQEAASSGDVAPEEPGLLVEIDGIARFYPYNILVWHEIVNDTFNDQRVLVTYCPLCLSGIVFDPVVDGERVEFGTSGKLWNSNLVMYDRKNESLWSQVLGEAIVGPDTGKKLTVLPSDRITFETFQKEYPNGEVLTRDTGATRFYGQDPYGDYYTTEGVIFPLDNEDSRLNQKAYVLGIVVDGKAKAYLPEAVQKLGEVVDEFQGKTIVLRYDEDLDAVRMYERNADGTEERINPFPNFWFSWVAAHPDTELFK